jgi:hypothetical protein
MVDPTTTKPTRKKAGRTKKQPAPLSPVQVIREGREGQAARIVQYLTLKRGRPPTNAELLGWANGLREGAAALDAFVQAGGMDTKDPVEVEEVVSGPKSKRKRDMGFRFNEQRADAVCDACGSPGHTEDRCPEIA